MHRSSLWIGVLAVCFLTTGCDNKGRTTAAGDINTTLVRLPDGHEVRAEMMLRPNQLTRGMKYRESLADDRGMLFVHGKPGKYPYWMYEVKVPLDIIWLDKSGRVVQLIHNAPPCPGPTDKCPMYGGHFDATYVLEVASGVAKQHGVKPDAILRF